MGPSSFRGLNSPMKAQNLNQETCTNLITPVPTQVMQVL